MNFAANTEAHLGKLGAISGFNSMAVFHDYWMASENINSQFMLAATIAPAMYVNYGALGTEYYRRLYRNVSN